MSELKVGDTVRVRIYNSPTAMGMSPLRFVYVDQGRVGKVIAIVDNPMGRSIGDPYVSKFVIVEFADQEQKAFDKIYLEKLDV